MVSGTYLFFKLSNQIGQGMREKIMENDMGLNREGTEGDKHCRVKRKS